MIEWGEAAGCFDVEGNMNFVTSIPEHFCVAENCSSSLFSSKFYTFSVFFTKRGAFNKPGP